jgi:uncharacterized SAM-binding protein YcdF (DUF218 family)
LAGDQLRRPSVRPVRVLPSTRAGRSFLVLAVLVAVFLAATARLFVFPQTEPPTRVDAIVALGGDPGQLRAHKAIRLAVDGFARTVLISRGGIRPAPCLKAPPQIRVICFRANPLDTRGEAEYATRLAARKKWTRLIVVPEHSQSTRARLLFERCTNARLYIVPVSDPPVRLFAHVVYEWGALLKALVLKRSC